MAYDEEREIDADDDGDEEETDEVPERPRKRGQARPVAVAAPDIPLSPFGAVPTNTTHWAIRRRNAVTGKFEPLSYAKEGDSVEGWEWPLSELSFETIRDRWGAGVFRTSWIGATARGARAHIAQGRIITLRDMTPAPTAPVVAPPLIAGEGLPAGFNTALAVLNVIEQRSSAQITAMAQLAQMMGGNRGGIDSNVIALLVQNQQQQTQAIVQALQASNEALSRRIDALVASDDEEDDGAPGVAGAAAGVAKAVVPALVKPGKPIGDGLKAAAANWFIADPQGAVAQVIALAGAVPGALDALARQSVQAQHARGAPAPPPVVHAAPAPRPRAVASAPPASALVPDPGWTSVASAPDPAPAIANGAG